MIKRVGLKRDENGKTLPQTREEAIARFWLLVSAVGPIPAHRPDLGPCWPWKGALWLGYGWFMSKALGGRKSAPRHAWEIRNGREMPKGMEPDHLCRNRACCRPEHLEAVTAVENTLRGNAWSGRNKRKTHCIHGHEFTPENIRYTMSRGRKCRQCRACERKREAIRRSQKMLSNDLLLSERKSTV